MYSYRHFKPGTRKNTGRMIQYVAEYNNYSVDGKINTCYCIPDKYDKNTPGSDSPSIKVSNAMRLSQLIQSSKGGKTFYGNFYLNQPLDVNYLGKTAGMPGGSGMPPLNRFN
jgi:hypothetical protein